MIQTGFYMKFLFAFCELFVWVASECKWFVFPCKHRQEIHSPEKVMIGWRNSSKTEYNCAKIQKLLIISIFFCLESPPKLLLKACLLSVCLRSPPVYFVPKIGAHLLRMSQNIFNLKIGLKHVLRMEENSVKTLCYSRQSDSIFPCHALPT